jgi:seryl-tRNA synthetase
MIDINKIRKNLDLVKENLLRRGYFEIDCDQIFIKDQNIRKLKLKIDQINHKVKINSSVYFSLSKEKKKEEKNLIREEIMELKKELDSLNKKVDVLQDQLNYLISFIPNLLSKDIPIIDKEIYKHEPLNKKYDSWSYEQIASELKLISFKNAAKISGSKFVIYQNQGSKLIRSLMNYMLDCHTKNGYIEFLPPVIINENTLKATGHLPRFFDDLFKLTNNKFLSPTAEIQLTSMYGNSSFREKDLPLKFCSFTNCFRSEAGSYGKRDKGLIRMHQFNKVELVQLVKPEESYFVLELMVEYLANILKTLNLPFRLICLDEKNVSFSSAKTYDFEVWSPFQKKYIEISSISNCEDFQTRELKIKFQEINKKKNVFLHSLNGSGFALDRIFALLLENNFSEKDKTFFIPEVLWNYMSIKELK